MQTLQHALDRQFPDDRAWTSGAVAALGVADPTSLDVVAVAKGWMRLHDGREPTLVDTLFVLMEDRLGFGQVEVASASDWVALSAVVAIDLIEGVPYPLDAIEVQFAGGFAIFVGWTTPFTDAVLDSLRPQTTPAPPPALEPIDAETVEPDASEPPTFEPIDAETVEPDAPEPPTFESPVPEADRRLDVDRAPGEVFAVEPNEVADVMAPTGPLEIEEIVEPDFGPDTEPDQLPSGPHLAPLFGPDAEPAIGPGAAAGGVASEAYDFFADLEHRDDQNAALFSVRSPDEDDEVPDMPVGAERVPGPWDDAAIQWPDPLRNCVFLGGHPQHQRRRKNVIVVMRPGGLVIAAGRSNGWSVHVPWHEVSRLDIQGADEVKFTHNHRIDLNGSALVVELQDKTALLVEVRGRRPATLRAGLAAVISVAGAGAGPTFGGAADVSSF